MDSSVECDPESKRIMEIWEWKIENKWKTLVPLHKEGVKVSFMNLDPCMNLECFTEDQVNFIDTGNRAIGKVIISVVNRRVIGCFPTTDMQTAPTPLPSEVAIST